MTTDGQDTSRIHELVDVVRDLAGVPAGESYRIPAPDDVRTPTPTPAPSPNAGR